MRKNKIGLMLLIGLFLLPVAFAADVDYYMEVDSDGDGAGDSGTITEGDGFSILVYLDVNSEILDTSFVLEPDTGVAISSASSAGLVDSATVSYNTEVSGTSATGWKYGETTIVSPVSVGDGQLFVTLSASADSSGTTTFSFTEASAAYGFLSSLTTTGSDYTLIIESASSGTTDADRDGYDSTTDCDDSDATVYQNLNLFSDNDGDGYGAGSASIVCSGDSAGTGYSEDSSDCNDNDADAFEIETFYVDSDGDGYGTSDNAIPTKSSCGVEVGYADNNDDCDDSDSSITLGDTYYYDGDGDGYGDSSVNEVACEVQTGYVTNNNDCDDSDNAVGDCSSGGPSGCSVLDLSLCTTETECSGSEPVVGVWDDDNSQCLDISGDADGDGVLNEFDQCINYGDVGEVYTTEPGGKFVGCLFGDYDQDGSVTVGDVTFFARSINARYGQIANTPEDIIDLDGSGVIDLGDARAFLGMLYSS
jgi:hypothetical protein